MKIKCDFCGKKVHPEDCFYITLLHDDGNIVQGLACVKCNPSKLPSYMPTLEQILESIGATPIQIKQVVGGVSKTEGLEDKGQY